MRALAHAALLLLVLAAAATPVAARPDSLRAAMPGDTLTERLRRPVGLAVDPLGQLWVSDDERHALSRFSAAGRWLDETGALGSEPGRFRRPGAVTALGALGVAVLDRENLRVVAYDSHARLLGVLVDWRASESEQRLGRVDPVTMAADQGGALLVGDRDRERLLEYDFRGVLLGERGGLGAAPGAIEGIAALAAGPGGMRVVLERGRRPRRREPGSTPAATSRVQWWDATGQVLRTATLPWARPDDGDLAVAVSPAGETAVANAASGEVVVFGTDGSERLRIAGCARPVALAFAGDGDLWVAEADAARVRRLRRAAAAER
jgi:DNA-binding beta-propeller fold protein YncE